MKPNQQPEEVRKIKLAQNSATIEVVENDNGEKSYKVVAATVGKRNRNDFVLTGDVIEMERDTYPLLYEHGKDVNSIIGYAKPYFDAEANAYMADIVPYDTNPNIIRSIENGAYDSVSIAYLIDSYTFGEDDEILVQHAIMREISLVVTGADPEARIFNNGINDEMRAEIEKHKANKALVEEIKKKYE